MQGSAAHVAVSLRLFVSTVQSKAVPAPSVSAQVGGTVGATMQHSSAVQGSAAHVAVSLRLFVSAVQSKAVPAPSVSAHVSSRVVNAQFGPP